MNIPFFQKDDSKCTHMKQKSSCSRVPRKGLTHPGGARTHSRIYIRPEVFTHQRGRAGWGLTQFLKVPSPESPSGGEVQNSRSAALGALFVPSSLVCGHSDQLGASVWQRQGKGLKQSNQVLMVGLSGLWQALVLVRTGASDKLLLS